MKYLCMIVRGTVPPASTYAGKDSKELLRTLATRGAEPSKALTEYVCKTLHLAFKQQSTEDIYDTLVFCFMRAARKYDPYYSDKTRKVCEVISEFPNKEFTRELVENRVDFDCLGICRSLVSKGFLASHIVKKKVMGYSRGPKWPAPAAYFESGPIGLSTCYKSGFGITSKNSSLLDCPIGSAERLIITPPLDDVWPWSPTATISKGPWPTWAGEPRDRLPMASRLAYSESLARTAAWETSGSAHFGPNSRPHATLFMPWPGLEPA